MRIVVALGDNALARRGEPMIGERSAHVATACPALAPVAGEHELVVTDGSGPRVGLLALQSSNVDATTGHGGTARRVGDVWRRVVPSPAPRRTSAGVLIARPGSLTLDRLAEIGAGSHSAALAAGGGYLVQVWPDLSAWVSRLRSLLARILPWRDPAGTGIGIPFVDYRRGDGRPRRLLSERERALEDLDQVWDLVRETTLLAGSAGGGAANRPERQVPLDRDQQARSRAVRVWVSVSVAVLFAALGLLLISGTTPVVAPAIGLVLVMLLVEAAVRRHLVAFVVNLARTATVALALWGLARLLLENVRAGVGVLLIVAALLMAAQGLSDAVRRHPSRDQSPSAPDQGREPAVVRGGAASGVRA